MKTVIVLLLAIPTMVYAQKHRDQQNMFYLNRVSAQMDRPLNYEQRLLKSIEGTDVRKVIKELQYKPNGKKQITTYYFGEPGKVTAIDYDGKRRMEITYEDTLVSTLTYSGKKTHQTRYRYVEGKMVLNERFAGDRLQSRTIVQYTEDGNVAFSSVNGKRNYSMYYTYDENGKVSSQRFMRDDKIVKVWNYVCDEKGQDEKVETEICKYTEESNDGSYVQYVRKLEKGEVLLYAHHYGADSVWRQSVCTNDEGEVQWESTKTGNIREYVSYKHGKEEQRTIQEYDEQERLILLRINYRRGDVETRYRYNTDGTFANEESTYKGKPSRTVAYTYN